MYQFVDLIKNRILADQKGLKFWVKFIFSYKRDLFFIF